MTEQETLAKLEGVFSSGSLSTIPPAPMLNDFRKLVAKYICTAEDEFLCIRFTANGGGKCSFRIQPDECCCNWSI
jgi:hypothetical protein